MPSRTITTRWPVTLLASSTAFRRASQRLWKKAASSTFAICRVRVVAPDAREGFDGIPRRRSVEPPQRLVDRLTRDRGQNL